MITLPLLCHVALHVIEDSALVQPDISTKQSVHAPVVVPVSHRCLPGTDRQPLLPKRHALPVVTSRLHAVMDVRRFADVTVNYPLILGQVSIFKSTHFSKQPL
jgi:hypothetical protein